MSTGLHLCQRLLSLCLVTSTLLACHLPAQQPLPLRPAVPALGALSENQQSSESPWQAYAQLPVEQQQALATALEQRQSFSSSLNQRQLLEQLFPLLERNYRYMLQPRTLNSQALPPGAEAVTLRSHDGLPLAAAWVKALQPTQQAIVVLHGYQLNKALAWQKYGFLQQRYNLLLLDQRGHNGQQGKVTLGVLESRDLQAAAEWLQQQGQREFGLFGESMGAAAAIVAGAQWAQSPQQQLFPLKAVWNDAAYADLEHAIGERVLRKLAAESQLAPELLKKWGAELITRTYLRWLAEDTQVELAEAVAAPRQFLPALVQRVAYAQVHSREDEQTAYENAQILQQLAEQHARIAPLFWTTTGKHVETYQQPDYAPRALGFFAQAFQQP